MRGIATDATIASSAWTRLRRCAYALALAAALAPATAHGASAGLTTDPGVLYTAGDLEQNHVTITVSGGAVTFSDPGKNMASASPGDCVTSGTNSITCTHPDGIELIVVDAGDKADTVVNSTSLPSVIDGGAAGIVKESDKLTGGSGPDELRGRSGLDTLIGGDGDDTLLGDSPGDNPDRDTLLGGGGHDDLDGGHDAADGEVLNGGSGNDLLMARGGDDTLVGGDGGFDTLFAGHGADSISGGNGTDVIRPGNDPNPDVLNGGAGVDIAAYDEITNEPVTVSLDGLANDGREVGCCGLDNVAGDFESIWGGAMGDVLTGNSNAQQLNGFGGDDTLNGGLGADGFSGGDGVDTVTYAGRPNKVTASIDGVANDGELGEGDDVDDDVENLTGGAHNDTLIGNSGANALDGATGGDLLLGGSGVDALIGSGSNDTLDGGSGNDDFSGGDGFDTADYSARTLAIDVDLDDTADDGTSLGFFPEFDNVHADVERVFGGKAGDLLVGSAGPNTLVGNAGADKLEGTEGADTINGGPDPDTALGGQGDDLFESSSSMRGADGADSYNGGQGADRVSYATRTVGIEVDLDDAADDGAPSEGDNVLANVENVTGGAGSDSLTGNQLANALVGGSGADQIEGLDGADTLSGGSGLDDLLGGGQDDRLDGGLDADTLAGNDGTDTVDYSNSGNPAGVDATIDGAAADGAPGEGDNIATTVENLIGSRFDDFLQATNAANHVDGGLGDDELVARGGPDTIIGGGGADELLGGAGGDLLKALDGFADDLNCGDDVDTHEADAALDTIGPSCE